MRIGFIMDPLSTVKPEKDTSYFLMLAAFERGHQVFYIDQASLELQGKELFARASELRVSKDLKRPFEVLNDAMTDLATMDSVWVRTDPPFDRRYFYMTLCLDFIADRVAVINAPEALRNWNEKLSALRFPQWTPKTLFTSNRDSVEKFIEEQGGAVIKPVDGHGGRGIHLIRKNDHQSRELIDTAIGRSEDASSKKKIVVQEIVEDAHLGDKRVLLLDGEPLGSVLRVGEPGKLNNLDQGGEAVATELTDVDLDICKAMKETFKAEGLFFVGIDVLGKSLTEVNVTSPTGLQEASRFSGEALHHKVIEKLESKLAPS